MPTLPNKIFNRIYYAALETPNKNYTNEREKLSLILGNYIDLIIPEDLKRIIDKFPNLLQTTQAISFRYKIKDGTHTERVYIPKPIPLIRVKGQSKWDSSFHLDDSLDSFPNPEKELIMDQIERTIESFEATEEVKELFLNEIRYMKIEDIELIYPEYYKFLEENSCKEEKCIEKELKDIEKQIKETI